MLYHISKIAGLKTLTPQLSSHNKAYVYAVKNQVTGLLFGASHDDFDFIIDEECGKPVIAECYPDAFHSVFGGRSCSVYEVNEDGFMCGMTSWDVEFVSEKEVTVINEILVDDLFLRLLDEEKNGNLVIHRYEDTVPYRKTVSEHIVDRLIRFDALYTENEKLSKHYGKIIDALKNITDGHLL